MKKELTVIASIGIGLLLDVSYAQDSIDIRHIGTIKMEYAKNWYSYNFVICAEEHKIEPNKFRIVSDIESKIVDHESTIEVGNCISFGVMIHSNHPDNITTEIIT